MFESYLEKDKKSYIIPLMSDKDDINLMTCDPINKNTLEPHSLEKNQTHLTVALKCAGAR